ncbi:hypothetical protein [Micromonospora sp. NPDC005171]
MSAEHTADAMVPPPSRRAGRRTPTAIVDDPIPSRRRSRSAVS